jgi:hypothetical protein
MTLKIDPGARYGHGVVISGRKRDTINPGRSKSSHPGATNRDKGGEIRIRRAIADSKTGTVIEVVTMNI